jgi:zinc protease
MMRIRSALVAALILVSSAGRAEAQSDTTVRAKPPAPGPLRPYDFPRVERFSLTNGVTVVVLERHVMPLVTASVIVDAGALHEPRSQSGVASLTGSLLSTGTRTLTGAQIAERMERLGARFDTFGDHLQAGASVTALSSAFADAFALAATTVLEPSFPDGEFQRLRNEALANIAQRRATVEGLAPELFARAVFDSASAYSRPAEGVPATVSRLTRDDVVRWYESMFGPRATTVLLVGDITPAAARSLVERTFGGWRASGGAGTRSPVVRAADQARAAQERGPRMILVDRPGSVQSGIAIGQVGIATTDPDYLRFVALNRVLGGGFNSRVNMNLRERHGYTYGAFSQLQARRGSGAMVIVSPVRTDVTDSALVEALGEWRRIAREPVPAAEFRAAVDNIVSNFPSSVQTIQGIRQRVATAITTGLPLDFYATYRDRLAAVTAADAHAAATRVLRPDTPTVVVVGDLKTVEPRVRALGLGTVEVWDAEGSRQR